ncbi:MAG: HEPN domain-containing protein [Opitutaceae bacterium]
MQPESEPWIRFARDDLAVGRLALEGGYFHQACFHAQQASEKFLKAWWAGRLLAVPRTHKLTDLLSLPKIPIDDAFRLRIQKLDRFYIPTRYPDALPGSLPQGLPGADDAKEALDVATALAGYFG